MKIKKKIFLTLFELINKPTPIGMNKIPMKKKDGRTVPAVKTGCQAGSFCCLNFESEKIKKNQKNFFQI